MNLGCFVDFLKVYFLQMTEKVFGAAHPEPTPKAEQSPPQTGQSATAAPNGPVPRPGSALKSARPRTGQIKDSTLIFRNLFRQELLT